MDICELVGVKRAEILRIAEANGATRVRLFGSVASGTATMTSDVNVFVDLEPGRCLLHLVAIQQDLEDLLGRQVHVVTKGLYSPYMRDEILRDATPLCARLCSSSLEPCLCAPAVAIVEDGRGP